MSPGCHQPQPPEPAATWRGTAPCSETGNTLCSPPHGGGSGTGAAPPACHAWGDTGDIVTIPTVPPWGAHHHGDRWEQETSDCGKERVDERAHPHSVWGLEAALVPSASAAASLRALSRQLGRPQGLVHAGHGQGPSDAPGQSLAPDPSPSPAPWKKSPHSPNLHVALQTPVYRRRAGPGGVFSFLREAGVQREVLLSSFFFLMCSSHSVISTEQPFHLLGARAVPHLGAFEVRFLCLHLCKRISAAKVA